MFNFFRYNMFKNRNIIFIGMPGVGKTTIAKDYAQRTGRQYIDLDQYIEKNLNKSIDEIFKKEGEDGFRQVELRCLKKIERRMNTVFAFGGGTICNYLNFKTARNMGILVYLKASNNELVKRIIQSQTKRPLLNNYKTNEEILNYLNELLIKREQYYNAADFIINTDFNSIDCIYLELIDFEKMLNVKNIQREDIKFVDNIQNESEIITNQKDLETKEILKNELSISITNTDFPTQVQDIFKTKINISENIQSEIDNKNIELKVETKNKLDLLIPARQELRHPHHRPKFGRNQRSK